MSTPAYDNDDRFRQRLENHREMPADAVWDGIAAALDKKKRKQRVLFWLRSAGLGLSAAAVLLPAILLTGQPSVEEGGFALRALQHDKHSTAASGFRSMSGRPSLATADQRNGQNSGTVSAAAAFSEQLPNDVSSPSQKTKTSPLSVSRNTGDKTVLPSDRSAVANGNSNKNGHAQPEKNAGNGTGSGNTSAPVVVVKKDKVSETVPTLPAGTENVPDRTVRVQTLSVISPEVYGTQPLPAARRTEIITHVPPVGAVASLEPIRQLPRIFEYSLSLQGNLGGVAYDRMTPGQSAPPPPDDPSANSSDVVKSSSREQEGLYWGTTFKAMFVFKRHLYLQGGLGYESFAFNDPYRFTLGGISSGEPPGSAISEANTKTAYGEVLVPVSSLQEESTQDGPGILSGKLRYRMQQLYFPIEIGYRYQYKKFGFSVGGGPGFHVPLGQQAVFVTEAGNRRDVDLRRLSRFNVSLGLETGVEYRPVHKLTLFTGLNLRYQMLNIYPDSPEITRPYSVSLYLGLRMNLTGLIRK